MTEPASRDIGVEPVVVEGGADGPRRSFASVVLAAVVVIGGAIALLVALRAPSPESRVANEASVETPTATVRDEPAAPAADTSSEEAHDAAAQHEAAQTAARELLATELAEHARVVSSLFFSEVDTPAITYGIAYPVDDGLLVLNRNGASLPTPTIAQNLGIVSVLPLLTTSEQTWAIDPRDDGLAYLVTNNFVVVQSARLNTLAVYNPASGAVELLASGQPAPGVELPDGVDVLPVQHRGLLVLPRTGGTYEVDGLADSLRRIDDGRAVAASVQATIFERCDEQLRCELIWRRGQDTLEITVPLEIGPPISLSPSGAWALQELDERNVMLTVDTGAIYELDSAPIKSVSWASTGDFVALLRANTIELFYPADRRSFVIDLVMEPSVDTLMLFSSTTTN